MLWTSLTFNNKELILILFMDNLPKICMVSKVDMFLALEERVQTLKEEEYKDEEYTIEFQTFDEIEESIPTESSIIMYNTHIPCKNIV